MERDLSHLNPQLANLHGHKVRVSPPYETMSGQKLSTFIVGQTTGWRPATLLIRRRNQLGSSELIGAGEKFSRVVDLGRVR